MPLIAVLAVPVAGAQASTYSRVLRVYENQGSIPPCQFSSPQLASALKSVDTYGAQYFADFTAAIQSALAARASGECSAAASAAPVTARSGGPVPPIAVTGATNASLPAPIALMGVLAGLFVVLGAAYGVSRNRGWDPAWAASWRHAWSEAGYRVGGGWSEFVDWLRSSP